VNLPSEITLRLKNVEDIFLASPASLYCKRTLNENAEEFIVEQAMALPRHAEISLKLVIPSYEIIMENEVATAIHKHFGFCREKSERKLKHTIQLGWRSFIIGFIFLTVMFLLTKVINRFLPQGGLAITLRELLIILGWVALWRPADLLLYDWYPHKRDANLFGRLERSKVQLILNDVI
jgi:hypothetical protein